MTALDRYARLEGSGLWRPDAGAQRRDVAVRLGKASLIIADSRSATVLSHWALASVQRENPGRMPARYIPAEPGVPAEGESLETDDELLIEALEALLLALNPPGRGRWLRWALVGLALAAALASMLWLPQIVTSRTAAIVPEAMRARIGRDILEDLNRPASGMRICNDPAGRQALASLRNRVLGPNWRVQVIDSPVDFGSTHLPGRVVLLSRGLVERLDSPEALAGWMLAEELAAEGRDPLLEVLRHTGLRSSLGLLSTGTLPDGALTGYGRHALQQRAAWPGAEALAARLAALSVAPGPFAASLPQGQARLAAALPVDLPPGPALLTDGQWLTLQALCQQ